MIKHGVCLNCGKIIIEAKVVDMKIIDCLTVQYGEMEFELTDGSKMRVCICKDCKESGKVDKRKVIECVIDQWREGINNLNISEEDKLTHLKHYTGLKIKDNKETKKEIN